MKRQGRDTENTPDHIQKARYVVSKNLYSLLAIILGLVGVLNLIQRDINMIPLLSGSALSLLCLWILTSSRNYRLAAIIALFMAFGLTIYNMCITSNFGHFVDFFWIVVIAIYVFFVLGNRWGIFNLFINISAVVVILYLVQVEIIVQVAKPYTAFSQANFIINMLISGIVFSYVTIKVLSALRTSEEGFIQANKELTHSNEEKTIMLKEIHHRVKNNLQVITSLLRLQLNEVKDEESRHHFLDSINRVSAMAIIHEKMYQTEAISRIDLESYLESLIHDLLASYAVNLDITTTVSSNVKNIEPESIVPLALIFNELVSNSLEHAFNERTQGRISVDVHQSSSGSTTVHYQDDGIWKTPKKEQSFGIELIETFAEQLDGSYSREILPTGTHYRFEFDKLL